MIEIWKDINNFNGLYKINNMGAIYSYHSNKLISQKINRYGYVFVSLSKNGIKYQYTVHKLVAMTFLENINNFKEINHKNNIKTDNNVLNLEWCNSSQNKHHYFELIQNRKRGITWNKQKRKWQAQINYNGKNRLIGRFFNKEDAYTAFYNKYLEIYNTPPWN